MTVSDTRATSLIGGRYTLEGPLGRGGMAEVQAGTDLRLQRPVAVKLLLPEMAAREDIRRRFEAEACAAASFNDPHAVAVYDTGEHAGQPYIVMERLPGETLADRIVQGPADPDWVRRIACEVLGALGAAHAVGLVHRDVKPGNILLTADDHAKIADFGIAKSLEASDGSLDLTGTGQLLGTPAYLPPERLDGSPATARSDLYSLGVVLYEALTGHCPFPGETPVATAANIVAGVYQPLDEARPGLDPALVAAVDRALATDPDLRFPSAAAMAAALAPPAAGAPTLVAAAGGAGDTAVIDLDEVAATRVGEPAAVAAAAGFGTSRGRRPGPSRAVLGVVVAVLFVALLVAALNRRHHADQPVSTQTVSTQTTAVRPEPQATSGATGGSQAGVTVTTQAVVTVPAAPAPAPAKGGKDKGGKGKG